MCHETRDGRQTVHEEQRTTCFRCPACSVVRTSPALSTPLPSSPSQNEESLLICGLLKAVLNFWSYGSLSAITVSHRFLCIFIRHLNITLQTVHCGFTGPVNWVDAVAAEADTVCERQKSS